MAVVVCSLWSCATVEAVHGVRDNTPVRRHFFTLLYSHCLVLSYC